MNIYGLLICTTFFYIQTIDSIIHTGTKMLLYMKKSKNSFSPLYSPKSNNQAEYVKYLNNYESKLIISTGPAGCGKTLFACQKAVTDLKSEYISKIIITRPVVSVDEEIGFLPGNIIKKMDPWTKPIFDIFLEHYSKTELDLMLMNGKIEICPLAFMRGRTFKHSFIIADEMQNSSPNQMKMLVTRLGDQSRMVITGDLQQTDIYKENGLHDFVNKIEKFNEPSNIIKLIKLDSGDIERSDVVRKVLEIYEHNTTKTFIPKNDTIVQKPNLKNINKNNDAALIPINHITRYYDVFSNETSFS